MAVDLEILQLSHGSQIPRNLGTRFPNLTTLDLVNCEPTEALAVDLVEALLQLSSLRSLLNLNELSVMPRLISRNSAEDIEKVR